ncbi:aryl-sulfate sulfotransferase [Flavobacteriaceae bacterium]|nr:aryl-sulfate sulfotransferase [Flavobacteriaceae bacterium]
MKNLLYLLIIILIASCQSETIDPPIDPETVDPIPEEPLELASEVIVYEANLIEESSLIFTVDNGKKRSFLLDKEGKLIKEWNFNLSLGNDIFLESDGSLTGMFKPDEEPPFSFGGYGGIVQTIAPDETVQWSFDVHNENELAHHDVERLPNGNLIFLVWERTPIEQAQALGIETDYDLFTESIWEVNPQNNEVVWKWNSIDHIVQDLNAELPSFGDPELKKEKIYLNQNEISNGDIMHANALFYDNQRDLIYISVNFYDEVWVIDHSTSISESTGSTGGKYGKGGDLVYRFGQEIFDRNHSPNIIPEGYPGAGNVLVYSNGNEAGQSSVYELKLPNDEFLLEEQPNLIWSYTNELLFSHIVSSAYRLKNGNTLITEGDFGIWEITPDGEIAWKYESKEVFLWRSYPFYKDDPAILSLDLDY